MQKIFQYISRSELCPRYHKSEEEMFQKVKVYLKEKTGESMHIVSEATNVPILSIEEFLRQDRLEVTPSSPIILTSEMCGSRIISGRFMHVARKI